MLHMAKLECFGKRLSCHLSRALLLALTHTDQSASALSVIAVPVPSREAALVPRVQFPAAPVHCAFATCEASSCHIFMKALGVASDKCWYPVVSIAAYSSHSPVIYVAVGPCLGNCRSYQRVYHKQKHEQKHTKQAHCSRAS